MSMMKQSDKISLKNPFAMILTVVIIITLMLSLTAQSVHAGMMRSVQIKQVTGTVHIQKAGSIKSFRAYEGATLHQGDHIRTEAYSSVTFEVVDRGDRLTVDENSELYISDLRNESGNTHTSFYIWSGSMWAQVATLVQSEDIFEIETPAAFMGVRGTTLLVGVDPVTGESKFYIASGQGKVSKKGEEEQGKGTTLYPNEQITLDEDTDSEDFDAYKNTSDLDDLVSNTSHAIIEAIIANKAKIDQENEEYMAKLQADLGGASVSDQETIDRINQNLDNLVGNIVKKAIDQNKVDEAQIKVFIAKINEQLDKKLDLSKVKDQEFSAAEKAKQAQIKLLEEERKKKQDAEKLKQEELKNQNAELQKKLKEQLEKQKQEKQKAEEAAKKKAEEEFAKKLTDDAAKAAFEAKQKALADQKAKQNAAAESARILAAAKNQGNPTPAPATPAPIPTTPTPDPTPDPTPPVLTLVSPSEEVLSNALTLDIVVQAELDAQITVSDASYNILATSVGLGIGTDVTLKIIDLVEGEHILTVKSVDSAGNTTTIDVPSITVDITPPVIDWIEVPGENPTTRIAEIVVETEIGADIFILLDNVAIAKGIGAGDVPVKIELPELSVGEYWFTIKVIDKAGNETIQVADYRMIVYASEDWG